MEMRGDQNCLFKNIDKEDPNNSIRDCISEKMFHVTSIAFGGFHAYGNGWGMDGSDRHFLNGKKTSSGIPRNLLPKGDDDAFNMFENDEDVVDRMSNFDETYTFDY